MLLKNSARWVNTPRKIRLLSTFVVVAACFLLRQALDSVLKPYMPTEVFLVGSLIVAFFYGYIPGLIALVTGWLLGLYFFVEPYGELSAIDTLDLIVTADDFVIGLAGIAMIEFLQRTRYSMRLMLMVSDSRYRSLLRLDNHRVHHQRQSSRALRQISDIFSHLERVLVLFDQDRQSWPQPAFIAKLKHQDGAAAVPHWLSVVHADDRERVEKEVNLVLDGRREFRPIRFRTIGSDGRAEDLDCVCRSLALGAQRSVFALVLREPEDQSVQP